MKTSYKTILWTKEDSVGVLRFNRPERLNALNLEMHQELADLLSHLRKDPELRSVIVTGEGEAFCAGGDLHRFRDEARRHRERGGARELFSNNLSRAFLSMEIPLIAAINGTAVGGGFTLALTCDLRIASEGARFGAVFARVGLAPEYGSSFLLPRIVGLTRAAELILTARIFDAQEALGMGLLSEVVPADRLMERARELAHRIASLPPLAVRMAKRAIRHGLECTLSQALDYEELAETHCFSSHDHQEAVEAFLEHRDPRFQGF
jgi:2-(1,2-epoxy-1,2-dihydrophenyl)acetyl-CoA isomerase